jgi:serine/threonine protein phosphatase 1
LRTYHYRRPDPSAPPLGYPVDAATLVAIPSDWTVWAFGDVHGVRSALVDALCQADLVDTHGSWQGGPHVAVVGLGDYIDRGGDSRGVISCLRRLEAEMMAADSRLALIRGNHEQMLADILRGSNEWFDSWAAHGGHAFARSFGLGGAMRHVDALRTALREADPGLVSWLLGTLPYARWRDVLFVHGGIPNGHDLDSLLDSDGQLWDSDAFIAGVGFDRDPNLAGVRSAGVSRVVVGHLPKPVPTVDHHGTVLFLDTTAPNGGGGITVARIPPEGDFRRTRFARGDISRAPDRPRRARSWRWPLRSANHP